MTKENKPENVRLRFAPSPTGSIHIGNIRTALFNWLYARNINGTYILRIEDTDVSRSKMEHENTIYKELKWLGLDWDEGPEIGGEHGPYRQSERKEIYIENAEKLLTEGKAYECICTEEELEELREAQRNRGEVPRYNGRCKELSDEELIEYKEEGRKSVIRFDVPSGKKLIVNDLIKGEVEFESDGIGDFILIKSDGMPAYNFACVIDDFLMKITHVLRGEDHLSNTPRQVMIYDALGLEAPNFGHLSLILGPDKSKLSKRHGETFIGEYREKGFLPEAMVNFLALLGWSPTGEEELFKPEEIVEIFDINRVAKSAAVFDIEKLKWMNSHYIKEADNKRLFELVKPFVTRAGIMDENTMDDNFDWFIEIIEITKDQLNQLSDFPEKITIFVGDEVDLEENIKEEFLQDENNINLVRELKEGFGDLDEWSRENISSVIKSAGKKLKLKGKKLFMPTRIAVSGEKQGPELDSLIYLLGKEKALNRLESVLSQVS
ncbi:glutamate--tRNA ligase [Natranaerofaba carboxydovora]|uniref:glutamate--tRNA ligase n=1 Tax=Natranaerofaba carboxydovora TaxID=2742683 RepID=UPI001F12DF23|nr:glutamate--tRNA ligase [Natranaerofaba carboxydovora]UMZ75371.1 Glutamate--tRNA ligase 1 [Natranaerofaba carboxydovora]